MNESESVVLLGAQRRSSPAGEVRRAQAALARAYRLLGDLIAGPLDVDLIARARKSPLLGEALGADPCLDELAAEHHRAFEWSAFPHQGVYLDAGGWADGGSSTALRALFAQIGFVPRDDLPVDHLTNLLGLLALELEQGAEDQSLEVELLDRHLLRWLPCFAAAVRRLRLAFPAALASQLEDLALYHRELLSGPSLTSDFELQPSDSLLDDPETSLADIAAFLLSPVRSGLFLSREDILFVVRSSRCFCGFGDRQTMLLNALRTAVQHERLSELTEALSGLHRGWEERMEGRIIAGLPESLARPWIERSTDSRALLQVLGAAGRTFSASMSAEPKGPGVPPS
jgi:TorA maturation chaperone TorD